MDMTDLRAALPRLTAVEAAQDRERMRREMDRMEKRVADLEAEVGRLRQEREPPEQDADELADAGGTVR